MEGPPKVTTMDTDLKKILDELPDKPPRSRLEPYLEFIEELRVKGRTYRDIAEILAEKCAVQVTGSGVHDFVRSRSHRKKNQTAKIAERLAARGPARDTLSKASSGGEAQRKIDELKARNSNAEPHANKFEYNADEPLRLKKPMN